VVFVHGFLGNPSQWIQLRAVIERDVPGAYLDPSFDYSKFHTEWVDNPNIGPKLADRIVCLAASSRQGGGSGKVIVVAHSMGGLATRWAATKASNASQVANDIGLVVTISTPNLGTGWATVGLGLLDTLCTPSTLYGQTPSEPAGSFCGEWGALYAMRNYSNQIRTLPWLPGRIPVLALGGDVSIKVPLFLTSVTTNTHSDLAVSDHSAIQGVAGPAEGGGSAVVGCTMSIHLLDSEWYLLKAAAQGGVTGPACWHSALPHHPTVEQDTVEAIKRYLASTHPTRMVDIAPVLPDGQPKPGVTIVNGGTAQSCQGGSDIAPQAYRCFSGHFAYDPCWLDNADPAQDSVLCLEHPWDTKATFFKVASGGLPAFLGPTQPINPRFPWGVQLSDGEQCIAVQGTHDSDNGEVVDYSCGNSDRHVLLRTLSRATAQWTYRSAYYNGSGGYRPGPLERVITAWYASIDNGAAVDARGNDCTATALAAAAQAYEASHNNPEGPLPEINAQACDNGYAELVFTQSAPPPGYTATMAFKASAQGWQEIGKADFIQPGQFGIPVSVATAITSALSSAGQSERVPF
jgi:pimeloyl-ACP methyl ester carboxylesterase